MEMKEAYRNFIETYDGAPDNMTSFYAGWDAAIKFAQDWLGLPSNGHFEQKLQFWVTVRTRPFNDEGTETDDGSLCYHNWAVTYGNQIAYHNERFDDDANCWVPMESVKDSVAIKDPEFFLKHIEVLPESCNISAQAFHVNFDYKNYSVNI